MVTPTVDIEASHVPAVRQPDHIGQATAVEQARAVAEVQAAIIVAQRCPRSVPTAVAMMVESCQQQYLAERAFFRYNRGGSQVNGESIHLARELARCWGNLQYGIAELSRDDGKGESEMLAFAWDVQTNTRATSTFIVKHLRDTTRGTKQLTDQRDIYENNANMGARRLREQIFAILPKWFTEQAKEVCHQTIEKGGDKPLPQRIAEAVKSYANSGVSQQQLEDKLGRKMADWIPADVAQLQVIWRSLAAGEATIEDEFPSARVTAAEIIGQQTVREATGPQQPAEPTEEDIAAMNAEAAAQQAVDDTGESSGLFGVEPPASTE